jgi:hypothetical protein
MTWVCMSLAIAIVVSLCLSPYTAATAATVTAVDGEDCTTLLGQRGHSVFHSTYGLSDSESQSVTVSDSARLSTPGPSRAPGDVPGAVPQRPVNLVQLQSVRLVEERVQPSLGSRTRDVESESESDFGSGPRRRYRG